MSKNQGGHAETGKLWLVSKALFLYYKQKTKERGESA
jgi:hypothetical protein